MSDGPSEQLYWHCLSCGAHETVEPTGDEGAYSLGDCEPCISCDRGTTHVMTVKLAAAYEQGRALSMNCDDAWERAKVLAEEQPATGAPGLTHDQLVVACRNIGYSLECGECASIFFTGYGGYPHDDACSRKSAEPATGAGRFDVMTDGQRMQAVLDASIRLYDLGGYVVCEDTKAGKAWAVAVAALKAARMKGGEGR